MQLCMLWLEYELQPGGILFMKWHRADVAEGHSLVCLFQCSHEPLSHYACIFCLHCIFAENIQDVCAAMNNVSQFIKAGLPGSECVYTVNGSNICENCLDLNCSLAIMVSGLPLTIVSEFSLLPCHDGNLDVPIHVIGSRIFTVTGQELFGRQSNQSFEDSFELTVLSATVTVLVSAMIENRGNGVFFRVSTPNVSTQLTVVLVS